MFLNQCVISVCLLKICSPNNFNNPLETTTTTKIELPQVASLSDVTAPEGADATFSLQVTAGKPKPQVSWFINDQQITIESPYEVTEADRSHTLTIKNVKPEYSALYSARVFNDAGSVDSNKASLTVQCKTKRNSFLTPFPSSA